MKQLCVRLEVCSHGCCNLSLFYNIIMIQIRKKTIPVIIPIIGFVYCINHVKTILCSDINKQLCNSLFLVLICLLSLRDEWVLVGLCYPSDTTFQIMADINDRQRNTFDDITDYGTVSSLSELEKRPLERKYFFDQSVG